LAIAAAFFWRALRHNLDELLQRVVLEGLALPLSLDVPLAALDVNLKTAAALPFGVDPSVRLLTPAILVAIGVSAAWRR
jgi:hypothetical protein